MGKMRFKLSHVMPHAWFYKLKEVGKPGRSLTYKASEPRKSAYASPINHKAIDIPFPADTPKKNSLIESPFPEDFTSLDQLHLVELSEECRPSIVLPHTSACRLDQKIMRFSLDGDDPHGLSSAPDVEAGSVSCGVNFDVRELERRLKDLGSEDRRKYYTSPMLLSVAVPTPMIDDGVHSGIVRTHDEGLEAHKPALDMCTNAFSSDVFGPKDRERSPLMNADAYADDERPFDGNGDGLCRSIDESNRRSTSSSDTGFERGSSSMWERDVFSITSDGSEAFTTTCADDVELMHKSRQRFRRLRERMSPSLYASGHMDNGLSRFFEDNQEAGLAQNDMMIGFYKDGHVADDVQDESDQVSHVCDRDQDVADDDSGRGLYVHSSSTCIDDLSRNKLSNCNSHERMFSVLSPSKSLNFSKGSMRRGTQCLLDYEDISDSHSMQYDRNELLSAQYDSSDDRLSECTRSEFSYARCKERLLSNRTNSGQSRDWVMREAEKENLSNYAKFKLKQRRFAHSKANASSGGMYLDPGLYNNVSRGKQSYAYDNVDSTDVDSTALTSTIPSTFEQHSDLAQLRRPRTSIYNIKSPHHRAKGLAGQVRNNITMHEKGPSWFKGTLRAVREKTRDPSFERFSPSTSGGGATPTRGERSRVFDSFAMVKSSYDPKHDFKESMVEMIMEKDLHSSHDMVELLQCYLTLNADAYHDTIVKVFTEVWSEMFQHI